MPRPALTAAALAALTAAPACATPQAQPAPPSNDTIVGGFEPSEVTPEVQEAARFALAQRNIAASRLARIEAVSRQVVAGTNYRMDLVLTDGARWRVLVWRQLDGSHVLTEAERVGGN